MSHNFAKARLILFSAALATACADTTGSVGIRADPGEGALPLEVAFSAKASTVPQPFQARWDLGDGTTSNDAEFLHTYLASGVFQVSLEITDAAWDVWTAQDTVTVQPGSCPTQGDSVEFGTVESTDIDEISGLAASRINPGVLWVHNDSGDSARVFAISYDGALLGTYYLADTAAFDWEDMAAGQDPESGEGLLYLGDIGDNYQVREAVAVLIVPEPQVSVEQDPVEEDLQASTVFLSYPGGALDAETLMVDPQTADIYIVSKDYQGQTFVLRKAAPHVDGETAEMEVVA